MALQWLLFPSPEMQTKREVIDWFVAISTSLLAFIFLLSFAVGPAVLWPDAFDSASTPFIVVAMCLASLAAGGVWLAPRRVQFHVCFWSGVAILVGALLLVFYAIHISHTEHRSGTLETAVSFIALTIMCAQILLTTALFLDRPTPPRR